MAKIPADMRLTSGEIDELMRRERVVRISTIGPDHKINLTPMTFGWANGKVYIFGRGQKIANLRRNTTATVLLDVGERWRDLQGIMMQGTASVLESAVHEKDDEGLFAARMNLGQKHELLKDGEVFPYGATASGRSRRWIVFEPEHIVSWNNARLPSHK